MHDIIVKMREHKNTVMRLLASVSTVVGVFLVASPVAAQINTSVGDGLALSSRDPIEVILYILSWLLGIAGFLLVFYILYGGWLWMSSRGEQDKIDKAKRVLQQGVVGLVIIMSAWGITLYLLRLFSDATGTQLGGSNVNNCIGCSVPKGGSSFYVMSTHPSANQTDVYLCSDITVRMSDYVNQDTVTSDNWYLQVEEGLGEGESCSANNSCASALCQDGQCVGETVAGTIGFGPGDSTKYFNFIPDEDLPEGTTYLAHVEGGEGGVVDADGVAMSSSYEWTFTTGSDTDEIPPVVEENGSSPFPVDGEVDVCLNTVINFDFNEPMRVSSFNDDTAMVLDEAGGSWADPLELKNWSFGANFDYASARPRTQLETYSEYQVRLYGGDATDDFSGAPTDSCGNPLDGDADGVAEGDTVDNYYGYDADAGESEEPITWETGENASCTPIISSVTPTADYYSDYDGKHHGQSCSDASECSSGVCTSGQCVGYGSTSLTIEGLYLAPHPEVKFDGSTVWAGDGFNTCFDENHLGTITSDTSVGDYCLSDNDQEQSTLLLRTPVGSADTHIQVEVAGERSEESADELDVLSPQINWLSPDDGAPGQYITIDGQNFGSTQGDGYVVMRSADNTRQAFLDLPEACDDVWSSDEILVVAPEDYTLVEDGSPGTWESGDVAYIQVVTNEGLYSDLQEFTFNDTTRPNLCSVVPSCHEAGGQSFTLNGDNFGDLNDDDAVYFSISDGVGYEGSIASWESTEIVGDTNADMDDGTFYVNVYDADTGEYSNSRSYEIPCNVGPQVVQIASCNQDEGIYPVPNPRPNNTTACINAHVGVLFDQEMDESTYTSSTVYLKQYNTVDDSSEGFDDTVTPKDVLGDFDITDWQVTINGEDDDADNDIDYYGFQYDVLRTEDERGDYSGYLQPNTWYELTVTTGVASTEGLNLTETYTQRFKTDESEEACEADTVDTSPVSATLNSYWSGTDVNNQTYTGSAYDANCSLLDPGSYSWDWSTDNSSVGVFAGSEETVTGGNSQEVYAVGSTSDNEGRAIITAAIESISDTANFYVDLGYCETDGDCASCSGSVCDEDTSRCTPVITDITPANGDHGTWVTVDGCYFGSTKGSIYMSAESETYAQYAAAVAAYDEAEADGASDSELDSLQDSIDALEAIVFAEAEWPNAALCGDTWSNSQIIFEVPDYYDSDHDGDVEESGADADDVLPEDAYYIEIENYYGNTGEADDQFTVNETVRPGICSINPAIAGTGESVDVVGQNLTTTEGYASFLTEATDGDGNPVRTASTSITTWADAEIEQASVPVDAITGYSEADYDEDGFPDGDDGFIAVLSDATDYNCTDENDPNCSNPLDFQVSCDSNLDCASGCCGDSGLCLESSSCNTCATDDECNEASRCSYGGSSCEDGVCTPVIGEISPNSGPNERPVTIQGCYFGPYSATKSAVTFDTDENVVVDILCNNGWSNEQIIIEIPSETEEYSLTTTNDDGSEITVDYSTDFLAGTVSAVTVTNNVSMTSNSEDYTFTAQCTEDADVPDDGVPILCYLSLSSGRAASDDTTREGNSIQFIGENERYDYEEYSSTVDASGTYSGQYQEFYAGSDTYIAGDGQLITGTETYEVEGGGYIDSLDIARANVPYGATTGNARVQYPVEVSGVTNYCPSNELEFAVSCTSAADCPGGSFCIDGLCVEEACGCTYPAGDTDECGAPTNGCYYDTGRGEGCCAARPSFEEFTIEDGEEDVCLNALLEVSFDQEVDGYSDAIHLYEKTGETTDESGETVDVYSEVSGVSFSERSETTDDGTTYYIEVDPSALDPETQYKLEIVSEDDGGSDDIRSADTLLALSGGSEEFVFTTYESSCQPERVRIIESDSEEESYTFTEAGEVTDVRAVVEAEKSDGSYQEITESDEVTWAYSWEYYYDENHCENIAWVTEANDTDSEEQQIEAGTTNEERADINVALTWADTTRGEEGESGYESSDSDGDGTHEDALEDTMAVNTYFCNDDEELWSYVDQYGGSSYSEHTWPQNFGMFYCYDEDEEEVPNLELQYITQVGSTGLLLEYFWQNPSDDLVEEDEAFGIRVYSNSENLSPAKWYEENAVNPGSPGSYEIDGYEAVKDGSSYYVSVSTVIDDNNGDGTLNTGTYDLYNNMYVITFNDSDRMNEIEDAIVNSLSFNWNVDVYACEASDKSKLTRDTKRLNDLNTIAYRLNEYYGDLEDDGEDGEYPLPLSESFGSYLTEMTTSKWNSWQGALGNVLGSSLPEDPYNTFYVSSTDDPWSIEEDDIDTPWENDAFSEDEQCLNSPDENYHFDTSGTCWDEVNREFYCPENSHIYAYRVDESDQDDAYLFGHFEYDGGTDTEDWINNSSMIDPCTDGRGLSTDFTASCECFNYGITTGAGYTDAGAATTGTAGGPDDAEWVNY